jgi:hypothetical protein
MYLKALAFMAYTDRYMFSWKMDNSKKVFCRDLTDWEKLPLSIDSNNRGILLV